MQDLEGRITILTGGACGIGHEIARTLVRYKCRVILVNNLEIESILAMSSIQDELDCSDNLLSHQQCDMSDLCEVQSVFSNFCEELPRLDLCIFSAGIDIQHFQSDIHCIDSYFGMMWLGNFYACNLLWPLLRGTSKLPNTSAPRIIFECPGVQTPEQWETESSDEESDSLDTEICEEIYRRSKTSLVLGVRYGLAERIIKLHGDNIVALAVQPSNTCGAPDLARRDSHSGESELCDKLLDTLEDAAPLRTNSRSIVYAATSKEVETDFMHGAYLVDVATRGKETNLAADPSLGPGFWDISERAIRAVVGRDATVPWERCLD